jgi:hypothetical protein
LRRSALSNLWRSAIQSGRGICTAIQRRLEIKREVIRLTAKLIGKWAPAIISDASVIAVDHAKQAGEWIMSKTFKLLAVAAVVAASASSAFAASIPQQDRTAWFVDSGHYVNGQVPSEQSYADSANKQTLIEGRNSALIGNTSTDRNSMVEETGDWTDHVCVSNGRSNGSVICVCVVIHIEETDTSLAIDSKGTYRIARGQDGETLINSKAMGVKGRQRHRT